MPQAENDVLWAVIGSPWGLLAIWLIVINLVTFFVFGFDKLKAKYKEKHETARRVPEKTLFLLAALGGSVRVWRHKTLHKTFRIGIPLILAAQILIPAGLWLYWNVIR